MDLTEYRRRQQEAWLRRNADRLRREFWARKQREERTTNRNDAGEW